MPPNSGANGYAHSIAAYHFPQTESRLAPSTTEPHRQHTSTTPQGHPMCPPDCTDGDRGNGMLASPLRQGTRHRVNYHWL